jgi:hypothetical protein
MKIRWDYVFAGVSAIAGLYILKLQRTQASAGTTNVFPPLNTPDTASSDAETGVDADTGTTATSQGTTQTKPTLTPYPVYLV